jgi:hypothetical protein
MKNKIAIEIVLAILLVVIVAFSGCIKEQSLPEETPTIAPELPEQPIMTPAQPTIPTTQNINGNYKVQDVSFGYGCSIGYFGVCIMWLY